MPSNVTAKLVDHAVVGDTTLISSASLGSKLIQDRAAALTLINADAPSVKATDIYLDSAGRIVVRNQEFAAAINAKLSAAADVDAMLGNGTCGLGC